MGKIINSWEDIYLRKELRRTDKDSALWFSELRIGLHSIVFVKAVAILRRWHIIFGGYFAVRYL